MVEGIATGKFGSEITSVEVVCLQIFPSHWYLILNLYEPAGSQVNTLEVCQVAPLTILYSGVRVGTLSVILTMALPSAPQQVEGQSRVTESIVRLEQSTSHQRAPSETYQTGQVQLAEQSVHPSQVSPVSITQLPHKAVPWHEQSL